MFTGIIEATGHLENIQTKNGDLLVRVNSGQLDLTDVKLGDSIATNGVCLTVTELHAQGYSADVSAETFSLTGFERYQLGQKVNLEKALMVSSRLGGHLVSGHVDGVAEVIAIARTARAVEFWLRAPPALSKYISLKGSVCIDGISLTVNEVKGQEFKLTIVPHTVQETTMSNYQIGTLVNLEVDQIARYLERLLTCQEENTKQSNISMALLASAGFVNE